MQHILCFYLLTLRSFRKGSNQHTIFKGFNGSLVKRLLNGLKSFQIAWKKYTSLQKNNAFIILFKTL
jgi:hypothetical protein